MSDTIRVCRETVSIHKNAISGLSSSFDVTVPPVEGGNVPAIAEASRIGTERACPFASRYASVLPKSANYIQEIADTLGVHDGDLASAMRSGGSGGSDMHMTVS